MFTHRPLTKKIIENLKQGVEKQLKWISEGSPQQRHKVVSSTEHEIHVKRSDSLPRRALNPHSDVKKFQ